MVFKHSYLVPIAFSILMPITFIITYTMAVFNKNVTPVFPYISDTGSWSPESCIFTFLLSIAALLLAYTVYIRYRQLKDLLCDKNDFKLYLQKLNKISYYFGLTASLGIIVVGSFQETNVLSVHLLGAMMTFGCGSVYHIIQVLICFALYPVFGNKNINVCRAACTFLYFIAVGILGVFMLLSFLKFKGKDITKWTEDDGGYTEHLISTIAEWIMVGLNQLLIALYAPEFKLVHILEP